MHNSYLQLDHHAATAPVLFKGLRDAKRIINGVWRLEVEPVEKSLAPPLTLIPSYPDLPMEKVYPRAGKTDVPGVILREHGRGRVVYFPWDIDRTFWEVLSPDHGKLLANSVAWATNEDAPVTVSGAGLLDVTIWRQKKSMTVHLVNLTNPMAMKGPFRELIPVGEQIVKVRLPEDRALGKIKLLAADKTPRVNRSGRELTIVVPSILDHEVVAIDLKS